MQSPKTLDDWKALLLPWIESLRGAIVLPPLDPLVDKEQLDRDIWLQVNIMFRPREEQRWVALLEALELINYLALLDNSKCWDLLLELADPRVTRSASGCPDEYFIGLRPRYELRFPPCAIPSQLIMMLILDGIPQALHSSDYAIVNPHIAVVSPAFPIQVRFDFPMVRTCLCCGNIHYRYERIHLQHLGVKDLKKIITMASLARSAHEVNTSLFEVVKFSLVSRLEGDDSRDLERQIANFVPISATAMRSPSVHSMPQSTFFGPYLWRLLAPHVNARSNLGAATVTIDRVSSMAAPGVCSALVQSKTVETAMVYGECSIEQWVLFAIFSSVATHHIRTSRLIIKNSTHQNLTTILEHPNPVAYLDALRRNVDLRRHPIDWEPTTIQINATTEIFGTEMPWSNTAKTVYHGKQVAECHMVGRDQGDMVSVLIPGVGFGRVRRCDVLCEEPTRRRDMHSIRSLTLETSTSRFQNPSGMIEDVLKLIGAPITKSR